MSTEPRKLLCDLRLHCVSKNPSKIPFLSKVVQEKTPFILSRMPLRNVNIQYDSTRCLTWSSLEVMHFSSQQHQISCRGRSTYLIAPGSTVTSAAAISVEIAKVLESTILTVPPLSCVGCTCENGKTNGVGMTPFGLTTSVALSEGGTIEQWSPWCAN